MPQEVVSQGDEPLADAEAGATEQRNLPRSQDAALLWRSISRVLARPKPFFHERDGKLLVLKNGYVRAPSPFARMLLERVMRRVAGMLEETECPQGGTPGNRGEFPLESLVDR